MINNSETGRKRIAKVELTVGNIKRADLKHRIIN